MPTNTPSTNASAQSATKSENPSPLMVARRDGFHYGLRQGIQSLDPSEPSDSQPGPLKPAPELHQTQGHPVPSVHPRLVRYVDGRTDRPLFCDPTLTSDPYAYARWQIRKNSEPAMGWGINPHRSQPTRSVTLPSARTRNREWFAGDWVVPSDDQESVIPLMYHCACCTASRSTAAEPFQGQNDDGAARKRDENIRLSADPWNSPMVERRPRRMTLSKPVRVLPRRRGARKKGSGGKGALVMRVPWKLG